MKNVNFPILLILTAAVLVIPLYALPKGDKTAVKQTVRLVENSSVTSVVESQGLPQIIRLYDSATKKITKIAIDDYLYGVVAGECPMLYHDEAIKAQIVAAHTYAVFRAAENVEKDYDITTDPETSQTYITKEKAKSNWGAAADKYDKKLRELINEVKNDIIMYKGKAILAVYHAISAGTTEKSVNVWGSDYPYLQCAESVADKLCNGYLTDMTLTVTEADKKLSLYGVTSQQLADAKIEKTACGNVMKITVNDKEIAVGNIVTAFGLRSQNFDVAIKNKNLCFTVRGYGHQVGMSQNGANYMANSGATYKEILQHYYKNTEVEECK